MDMSQWEVSDSVGSKVGMGKVLGTVTLNLKR